jgi:serine phosphatase RsbU (regulator of sigma subunit)
MILGLFENAVGTDSSVESALQRGDRVIIYTDGLAENFNSRREMLGVSGLQGIVAEASTLPLAEMKQQILHRVAAWRDGHPRMMSPSCCWRFPDVSSRLQT